MKENRKERPRARAYRRKERMGNRLAIIGITLVVLFLGVAVNFKSASMRKKDLEYQVREEALMAEVEREELRSADLKQYRVYVQTKQYIEEVAKQKLGLVKPDEILLKPNPR